MFRHLRELKDAFHHSLPAWARNAAPIMCSGGAGQCRQVMLRPVTVAEFYEENRSHCVGAIIAILILGGLHHGYVRI
jgi:hypothetical protein